MPQGRGGKKVEKREMSKQKKGKMRGGLEKRSKMGGKKIPTVPARGGLKTDVGVRRQGKKILHGREREKGEKKKNKTG